MKKKNYNHRHFTIYILFSYCKLTIFDLLLVKIGARKRFKLLTNIWDGSQLRHKSEAEVTLFI